MSLLKKMSAVDISRKFSASENNSNPPPALPPPCPACHSAVHWLDGYGRVHCWQCSPPPTESLIKKTIFSNSPATNKVDRNSQNTRSSQLYPLDLTNYGLGRWRFIPPGTPRAAAGGTYIREGFEGIKNVFLVDWPKFT